MIVEDIRIKSVRLTEPNDNEKFQIVFAVDDKKANKALVEMINDAWDEEGTGTPRNLPYFISEASDEFPADEDTGKTLFLANTTRIPAVYDASNVKIATENMPSVGRGTIANLSTSTYVWTYKKDMGIKLNFNGLQIIKLVEYTGGGDDFEATEGFKSGFSATDEEPKKKKKKKKKKKD